MYLNLSMMIRGLFRNFEKCTDWWEWWMGILGGSPWSNALFVALPREELIASQNCRNSEIKMWRAPWVSWQVTGRLWVLPRMKGPEFYPLPTADLSVDSSRMFPGCERHPPNSSPWVAVPGCVYLAPLESSLINQLASPLLCGNSISLPSLPLVFWFQVMARWEWTWSYPKPRANIPLLCIPPEWFYWKLKMGSEDGSLRKSLVNHWSWQFSHLHWIWLFQFHHIGLVINGWLLAPSVRIPAIYGITVLDFGVLAYSLYSSQQSWKWNIVSYLRRWRLSKIHSCIEPMCWVPACTRQCAVPGIPMESRMSMNPVLKELTSRVSGQVDRRV